MNLIAIDKDEKFWVSPDRIKSIRVLEGPELWINERTYISARLSDDNGVLRENITLGEQEDVKKDYKERVETITDLTLEVPEGLYSYKSRLSLAEILDRIKEIDVKAEKKDGLV